MSLTGYLAHPRKPRPRGNQYPTAANFQRVTPSKLELLKGTRRSWLKISSTWFDYGPNIASESLTWTNIGSIYAQQCPDMIQKRRVLFGPGKSQKGTRRSWLNISSTWHEYGPNMAPKSLTWINIHSNRLHIRSRFKVLYGPSF